MISLEKMEKSRAFDLPIESLRDIEAIVIAALLKNNSSLTSLNIQDNIVGDNGVSAIINILYTNTGLRRIDLSCNRISHHGAVSIAEILNCNQTLQTLFLKGKKIKD